MMNEMLAILADIPPMLAAAWAAWLGAGLLLTVWYRRAKAALEEQHAGSRVVPHHKSSGSRPVARTHVPQATPHPRPATAPAKRDPFADLAQIFEEETPPPPVDAAGNDSPTQKN